MVSLPSSSGGGCYSVVVISKFKFGRHIIENSAKETDLLLCLVLGAHLRGRGQLQIQECQQQGEMEESAVQAKKQRNLLLILGVVLFPVSGIIQVHHALEQCRFTPFTAATSISSHFLQQQCREAVPRTQCTIHSLTIVVIFGLLEVLHPLSVSMKASAATVWRYIPCLLPHHATNCIS